MLLLRIAAILAVIGIGTTLLAYLYTGQKRYLGMAWRIAKIALLFILALFALLTAERLIVLV